MDKKRIREKVNAATYGAAALIGFENCVTKVEFYKGNDGYYIYKAGTEMMLEDMICHASSIDEIVQFMRGALWFKIHGREFEK